MLLYLLLPVGVFYGLFVQRLTMKRPLLNNYGELFISRNNLTLVFWFFILMILMVFKDATVGTDSLMYVRFFRQSNYELFEPGIQFMYLLATSYENYLLLLFLVSVIFLLFMLKGIKENCPNYLIGILFLILSYIYFTSFNQIRQILVVSIIFYFVKFLLSSKEKYKFIFVILISLLFHQSAIFLVILFFIPKKKLNIIYIVPLFIATIVLYFIPEFKNMVGSFIIQLSGFYAQKYEMSLESFFSVNKDKGIIELIPVMVQMVIVVISYYYSEKVSHLNINYNLFSFSFNIVVVNLCLYALAGVEAVDRIQLYFSVFNIYFYSFLIHLLLNDRSKYQGKLLALFIVIFWIIYYILRILTNNQGIVPFQWNV